MICFRTPPPAPPSPARWALALLGLLPLAACSGGDAEGIDAPAGGPGFPGGPGLAATSDNPVELLGLAQQAAKAGNAEEAAELFRRVLELQPEYADAHFLLGTVLVPLASESAVALGSSSTDYEVLDEAIGHLERAAELKPDSAAYHYWLGRALDLRDRNQEAKEELERALELDPEHGKASKRLGLVLAETGDHEGARAAFERAAELMPRDAGVYYQLGNLALEQDPAGAKALYEKALGINPTLPNAYHGLSQALAQLGEETAAEEAQEQMELYSAQRDTLDALVRIASDEPGNVDAQFKAAEGHYLMGKYDAAMRYLERILLQLQPDHPQAHYYCGLIRMSEGNWTMAMNHLEECLYFAPDMVGPRIELLRVYEELGNTERVDELVGEVDVLIETVGNQGKNTYAEALIAVGREARALELLAEVQADDPENETAAILVARAKGE